MNTKEIKGNINLERLYIVTQNIGDMSPKELEQETLYIQNGIIAARKKINSASEKIKGYKYLIKEISKQLSKLDSNSINYDYRRSFLKGLIRKLVSNKKDALNDLFEAHIDKERFIRGYRNFRALMYIQKSVELLYKGK